MVSKKEVKTLCEKCQCAKCKLRREEELNAFIALQQKNSGTDIAILVGNYKWK